MIIIIITFCCALVVVFVAVAVTVALVVAGRCVLIVMLHNLPSAPQRQHRTDSEKKHSKRDKNTKAKKNYYHH